MSRTTTCKIIGKMGYTKRNNFRRANSDPSNLQLKRQKDSPPKRDKYARRCINYETKGREEIQDKAISSATK